MLVVSYEGRDNGTVGNMDVTGITYGGQSLTYASGSGVTIGTSADKDRTEIWYLLAPASGTDTVTITTTGVIDFLAGGVISLEGVAQQGPEAVTSNGYQDPGTSGLSVISTDITTITDGAWVIDVAGIDRIGTWTTTAAGMTKVWEQGASNKLDAAGGYTPVASAGSTTLSWEHSFSSTNSRRLVHSLVAFAPVPAAEPPAQVLNLSPAESATDVSVIEDLSWLGAVGAENYNVYFGTTSPGNPQGNQTEVSFDTGVMAYETIHYWRIDSNNAYGTTTGNVWSFTTEAFILPGQAGSESPIDSATDVSVIEDLSWSATNAENYNVYFGTTSPGALQGNQTEATFDTGIMAYETTYFWRIDSNSLAGLTAGNVWSFTTEAQAAPDQVANPVPTNSSTDMEVTVDLSWSAAVGADNYDIYFGSDPTPDAGEFQGNQSGLTFDPGTMVGDTTFYWRIDSNNTTGSTAGAVWSFTTAFSATDAEFIIRDTRVAPVIDGTVDAVWDGAIAYPYDNYVEAAPTGASDLSGTWKALWDSDNIYYLVDVNDANLVNDSDWRLWRDDSLEIHLDTDNSKGTSYDGINDFKYFFRWNDPNLYCDSVPDANVGVNFVIVARTGGYRLEVSIPWTTLAQTPYEGKLIGAGMAINDDDDGGMRDTQMLSLYTAGPSNPSQFMTAELVVFDSNAANDPVPADKAVEVPISSILSWTAGENAADVDGHHVYFGTDFDDVNAGVNGTDKGLQSLASYVPDALMELDTVYYWCVDEVNDSNIWLGKVWRFRTQLGQASEEVPANGSVDIDPTVVLSWLSGSLAADVDGHDIYFGTDFDDVNDANLGFDPAGVYQGSQDKDSNSFDPAGDLKCGRTYYWRIDEANGVELWPGEVWNFTVRCDQAVNSYIDEYDLSAFAEQWLGEGCHDVAGTAAWCCGADVDKSGRVDFGDYASLADKWLDMGRLGTLEIPAERVPEWNPGVEGGIPDTSTWPVFCDVTDSPYNAIADDGLSDWSAIQNALWAAGAAGGNQVVYVPAGTFRYNYGSGGVLKVPSNVVLRGAGRDTTTITGDRGGGPMVWAGVKFYGSAGASVDITTSSLPAGISSITVTDASGFSVGDFCRMSQDNDLSYIHSSRIAFDYMFHNFKITAINGNTITMDRPTRHYFGASFDPYIKKMNVVTNAGIEDIKIMNDLLTSAEWFGGLAKNTGPIGIYYAANCWLDNVFVYNGHQKMVHIECSTRISIVNCKFDKMMWAEYGKPGIGSPMTESPYNNYAVLLKDGTTDCLVENNIFMNQHAEVIIMNGTNGNVTAYNFVVNAKHPSSGFFFHGRYPHQNLLEGNATDGGFVVAENWWGEEGPRNTLFRNRCYGDIGHFKTGDITNDTYHPTHFLGDQINMIGNIAYAYYKTPFCNYDNGNCRDFDLLTTNMWLERNIYRDLRGAGHGLVIKTPEPTTTMINNYGGDVAPGSWSTFKMPASLYLDDKPSWWPGGKAWPCVGSDVDDFGGTLTKLPAEDRYDSE